MTALPRAVLTGPPGAGKSSVGAALARLWMCALRDTDADVEAAAGRSVADIFLTEGEARFREIERASVAEALCSHDGVLALGGGAVLDEGTQQLLSDYVSRGGTVVFLDVSLSTAARRVGLNRARPLLAVNPRRQWQELMEARRGIYESVATVTIATDDMTPDDVAASVDERAGAAS